MYWQSVREYPNHQYVTGMQQEPGKFMSDVIYSEAMDSLVICCADAAILHQVRLFVGLHFLVTNWANHFFISFSNTTT
jgi:hypothetical protein